MTVALSDNSRAVIERRIAPRDENNEPLEDAEQVFHRVANFVSSADRKYFKGYSEQEIEKKIARTAQAFYQRMANLEFLPNSPTLVNAGRPLGQLSACFVLPVEDNMEGIFDSVKNAALIHKTGGGTGFSFTRLRPAGNRVDVTSGIASGPVSFMEVFDKATEVIKQGGTRRGANMGILRVDHPDILAFIEMKADNTTLQNFNISVGVTDEFMAALLEGKEYSLQFNDVSYGSLPARDVWNKIVSNAWLTGDPGVVFLDRINEGRANPVPNLGPIEATNPCGEQPLYPYDSCNLGSINLGRFVDWNSVGVPFIDYARLKECVHDAVHFLDNIIDLNKYPLPQIEEVSHNIRRIGLGVMGWADMLISLDIPYDSEEAIQLARTVSSFISTEADSTSRLLATLRGSFPAIGDSIYAGEELRNSTRTTIAPTGTISIIAECSGGIEPLFGLAFVRSHFLDKDDPNKRYEMIDVNKHLYNALVQVYGDEEEVQEKIRALSNGSHLNEITDNTLIQRVFVTSHDIAPEWHIKMQAAWQENTDNAVSKTINLTSTATVEDVDKAYRMAYDTGCKGVTIYRDGSKGNQVLSLPSGKESGKDTLDATSDSDGRVGLSDLRTGADDEGEGEEVIGNINREYINNSTKSGIIHKFSVGEFKGRIILGLDETGSPCEVYIIGSKSGSTTRGYLDSIGVLISKSIQSGGDIEEVLQSLVGQRFDPSGFTSNPSLPVASSVVDYIARWIISLLQGKDIETPVSTGYTSLGNSEFHGDLCPECDGFLYPSEGCLTCSACGYSKCG